MRAYNLFRHREKRHVICAVLEDGPIPRFVAEKTWRFERKLTELKASPLGFDAAAATHGTQLNGFYLFQSFGAVHLAARARPLRASSFSAQADAP